MKPDELDAQITAAQRAGGRPFFVSCTVGTTVLGAFDPVNAIADVCEKHGLWLHADVSISFFLFYQVIIRVSPVLPDEVHLDI